MLSKLSKDKTISDSCTSAPSWRRLGRYFAAMVLVSFVLNEIWEMAQMSAYVETAGDSWTSTLALYTRAAVGEEILACHDANITASVPKPMTSSAKADGRFNKDAFVYDATNNEYTCPAGEALIWRFSSVEKGMNMRCYWSSKCQSCRLKNQCTPSTNRRVKRWEHEVVLEEMQGRLSHAPEMMKIRKRTVEHPFGTLNQWMGATHFLTRKLNGVSAEMNLNVLAYNLKRVMKIIGTEGLLKAMAA